MIKILIVEDDHLLSRMYKRILVFGGYEVEIADNGEDGFKKAKSFKPNIILTDVMMPKMNGFTLLKKLKKNPETANIMVVMLTNLKIKKDVDRAFDDGALRYVIKNEHEPKKILDVVRELTGTGDFD